MSLYRTILAAVAAIALAAPAFAEETITVPAGTSKTESVGGIQVEADATQAAQQAGAAKAQQPAEQTKLNLNTASAKELKTVKGLNATKARAIVNYRKKHGNFQSIDDLKNVSGFKKIKDEDMKSIQGQLTVG